MDQTYATSFASRRLSRSNVRLSQSNDAGFPDLVSARDPLLKGKAFVTLVAEVSVHRMLAVPVHFAVSKSERLARVQGGEACLQWVEPPVRPPRGISSDRRISTRTDEIKNPATVRPSYDPFTRHTTNE